MLWHWCLGAYSGKGTGTDLFSGDSAVKNLPAVQEMWVRLLVWEDPLEKETVTHSSILAWKIPWSEEPGGLQSLGSQRVGQDWTHTLQHGPLTQEDKGRVFVWWGRWEETSDKGRAEEGDRWRARSWQLYFFSSTGSFDFFSLIAMTRTCESNCYMLIEMRKLSEELRALKHILQFFAFYTSFLLVYVRIKHKNKTNKKDWNRKMFSIKCLTI